VAQAVTILFVEDDEPLRAVITEALSLKGFRVLATDSAYEAMQLLAEEHVDVLFADIVMPGLNGIELARQAKAFYPDLRIILATGYYSCAAAARSVGKLLFKPLRADEIEAEILNLMA
jgi:two-component system, cell cycle response regulator CpdR